MELKKIHQYDTYVPILSDLEKRHSWDQAVKSVVKALEPLGDEYCRRDGKRADHRPLVRSLSQSGQAERRVQLWQFRRGSLHHDELLPDVLDHVFTLAHEAGHSMHSFYSARNQPYQYWSYTIFVAEVASTFNEQLLARHMMEKAKNKRERAYLINRQIDGIRGTIVRQTMFAEFEKITHALGRIRRAADRGRAAPAEYANCSISTSARTSQSTTSWNWNACAFRTSTEPSYVFKYATGLSAAIALSERVVKGGRQELDDYLGFSRGDARNTRSICSAARASIWKNPTRSMRRWAYFDGLVGELDELL